MKKKKTPKFSVLQGVAKYIKSLPCEQKMRIINRNFDQFSLLVLNLFCGEDSVVLVTESS